MHWIRSGVQCETLATLTVATALRFMHPFPGKPLVNPLALCEAMEQVLPDATQKRSILVADGGDFVVRGMVVAVWRVAVRNVSETIHPSAVGCAQPQQVNGQTTISLRISSK